MLFMLCNAFSLTLSYWAAKNCLNKRKSASEFLFCIISKGRPDNVRHMQEFFVNTGVDPTWIVAEGEQKDYLDKGAKFVVEVYIYDLDTPEC